MADTQKVTVKNVSDGPRILNGANGPVLTHAGETTEAVEISAVELKIARATGYFEFDGAEAAEPGPLDQSVEKLTAHIATIDDPAEIERLLEGEKAGKTRTGAIAALEARLAELAGS
jgi:hypothetical protein